MANTNFEVATIGGGCFWCTEAVFQEVKGIKKVVSGYTGGKPPEDQHIEKSVLDSLDMPK